MIFKSIQIRTKYTNLLSGLQDKLVYLIQHDHNISAMVCLYHMSFIKVHNKYYIPILSMMCPLWTDIYIYIGMNEHPNFESY